jgi:hypothetical protein
MAGKEFSQDVARLHGQRIDSVARGSAPPPQTIPIFNLFEERLKCDAPVLVESDQLLHYCVWIDMGGQLSWLRIARSVEAA